MSKPRTGIPTDDGKSPFSSAFTGDTASKYSKPNTGALRGVVNESAHGEAMATKRYGYGTQHPNLRTGDETAEPQKAGDVNNLWAPGHPNDCEKDWRVGFGKGGAESAEGKPEAYGPTYRVKDSEPGTRVDGHSRPRMGETGPHYSDRPAKAFYGPTTKGKNDRET